MDTDFDDFVLGLIFSYKYGQINLVNVTPVVQRDWTSL